MLPYLTVPDPQAALDFYARGFGFTPRLVLRGPDGSIEHAEMSLETARIMIGPESEEHTARAPITTQTPCPVALYVYTPDVMRRHAEAVLAGAEVIEEPAVMPWGDRVVILADPFGYKWTFAQNLADFYTAMDGHGVEP
jgi:PhnB protein